MDSETARFDHLDRAGVAAARLALGHRRIVYGALGLAIVLSWMMLAAMAAATAQRSLPADVGPGGFLLRALPELPLPAMLERFVGLCLTPVQPGEASLPVFLALWLMWMLMALAMMLPTAAPMVKTYCEIADTARARQRPAAHPLVLVAGYLFTWAMASGLFAAAALIVHAALAAPVAAVPLTGFAASGALGLAGLYQFSGLKEACLRKCRDPFAILFSNWSDRNGRVFALGMRQGLWCLGCCWALMLVMFAVGVMNIFWMALVGLFALMEKQVEGRLASRLGGSILLVWAGALLLVTI